MKNAIVDIRMFVGVLFVAFFVGSLVYLPAGQVNATPNIKPTPTPKRTKYSEFPHAEKAHQLDCGKCHKFPSENWNKVRTASSAFPDITEYPKHQSCITCHKQQFFKGTPPRICSICHTTPSPSKASRHPFPNPREIFDKSQKGKTAESDFVVSFPHDKHIEIVSANGARKTEFIEASLTEGRHFRAGEESCAVCHQTMVPQGTSDDEYLTKPPTNIGDAFWLKKGTFKSSPIGHTTCFTCHSADTGILPAPETCAACHKIKPMQPPSDFDANLAVTMISDDKAMGDAWRERHSSGTFRHEFFAHVDLSCSTCHNVSSMNTADALTLKVSISSCSTCHVTATSDDGGALNYEMDKRKENPVFECVKCHVAFGKLAVPRSHIDALNSAAPTPAATAK